MLEIKNLKVTYHTGSHPVHGVDGVSFTIKKGESLGIMVEAGPAFEIFERPVHPATISMMHSSLNTFIN